MDNSNSAEEALDRFFDVLRLEIRSNPELASRLVKALGAEVTFAAEAMVEVFNPIEAVSTLDEAGFRAQAEHLSLTDVKTVLKRHNMATSVDLKGLNRDDALDLLYARAKQKLLERSSGA